MLMRRRSLLLALFAFAVGTAWPLTLPAQSPPPPPSGGLVYRPPTRGAPGGRVGGGTRSEGDRSLTIAVLAPDHPGLTLEEQPTLCWFLSKPTTLPLELTVTDPNAVKPLLETRLAAPKRPGIQCVQLAEHGLRLAAGVAYNWHIAAVVDPSYRSKDVVAGAVIERVPPKSGLREAAAAAPSDAPRLYADAGLWYDALAALSRLIDASPQSQELRRQRAGLLEQVGLREVAQHERQAQAPSN
jgi:Domain of Unknown Function (DUF928)